MFSPNSFPSNIVHVFAGCLRMKFWTILADSFIFVAQSALFGALFTGLDNVLVNQKWQTPGMAVFSNFQSYQFDVRNLEPRLIKQSLSL